MKGALCGVVREGEELQDFKGKVPTYFGGTSRHEMLERTVWHSTQHVRQVGALLGEVGITPTLIR